MAGSSLVVALVYLCCVAVAYLGYVVVYNVYFHPLARFPGPLLAKISDFYTYRSIVNQDRSMFLHKLLQQYGSPVRVAPNELVFSDVQAYPDIHGQSSQPCLKDPKMYKLLTATGATSLISSVDRVQHARLRRIVGPGFSLREVLRWEHLIAARVEAFVKLVLEPHCNGQAVDLYGKIQEHHLDIVSEISYGKSFDTLSGNPTASHKDVDHFLDVVPAISFFPAIKYLPIKSIKEGQEGLERLKTFSRNAVIECMTSLEKDKHSNAHDSFLKRLVNAKDPETGSKLTVDELVENTIIFLVAGTDTTAATTTYTLWECARKPEVRKKLCEEIRTAFPDPKIMPKYEDVCKLPYLNAVLDESLRLYGPSNITVPRVSPGRTIATHYIPKGVTVGNLPYATCRDSTIFSNPNQYIPERWLTSTPEMRDATRPFGYGPRNCVGRPLAEVGIFLTLARMFQLFDITVDSSMTEEMMRPRDRGVIQPFDARLAVNITKADPNAHARSRDFVEAEVETEMETEEEDELVEVNVFAKMDRFTALPVPMVQEGVSITATPTVAVSA